MTSEQLQERLSGLAEQMTTGIEEMHEGIAEASDKGKTHAAADPGDARGGAGRGAEGTGTG